MWYIWGMSNQTYPTDLTDRQWDCIKNLIPPPKAGGRPRSLDMGQVINAMLYLVVTGAQWWMLPKGYPNWKSVYHYFRLWQDDDTWPRIHDTLQAQVGRQAGGHKHPTAATTAANTSTGVSVIFWSIPWACCWLWSSPPPRSRTRPEPACCLSGWAAPARNCVALG